MCWWLTNNRRVCGNLIPLRHRRVWIITVWSERWVRQHQRQLPVRMSSWLLGLSGSGVCRYQWVRPAQRLWRQRQVLQRSRLLQVPLSARLQRTRPHVLPKLVRLLTHKPLYHSTANMLQEIPKFKCSSVGKWVNILIICSMQFSKYQVRQFLNFLPYFCNLSCNFLSPVT